MRRETFIRTFLLASALLLSSFAPCETTQAQAAGASITGRVTDPVGAAVRGATVTLYARGRTQLRLSTATDDAGAYRFERLAAGEYIVEVAAEGFAHSEAHTVNVERERDLALSATARQTVEDIERALRQMSENTFGLCVTCGDRIPLARLEVLLFRYGALRKLPAP